jgi:serine/threonine-protein kinase
MSASVGELIGGRYRLERRLREAPQASLWVASDQLAGGAGVALWQLPSGQPAEPMRALWNRWQQVLHPQIPRLGAPIEADDQLWLVREWQAGRSYQQLLQLRLERGLVYGPGEALLVLRQVLPVLAVLHGQQLAHGDLRPAQLLRRDGDGLPVLLDCCQLTAGRSLDAPPPEPSQDLRDLALLALTLMSGAPADQLHDRGSGTWLWPTVLAGEPALQAALARLLGGDTTERLVSAREALAVFEALPMPGSSGPVPRPEPSLMAPEPKPAARPEEGVMDVQPRIQEPRFHEPRSQEAAIELPPLPVAPSSPPASRRNRGASREEVAEGGIWPVLIALVLSAVVGTALGWWWLSRSKGAGPSIPDAALQLPGTLPQAEVDQRQQLLNRLRAMQVDRAWFLKLVDASLLARFPERGGRLPGDSSDDEPLRRVWNELAEEWLARVEQLPLDLRQRLGRFSMGDWERRQRSLVGQGLSSAVLRQLVSGSAQTLLPGHSDSGSDLPPEPFRQLWFAAAEQTLANVRIEPITAQGRETRVVTAEVDASGARLFPIRLPEGYRLVLGVNGSPLMQMSVFGADGELLESRGPLRVVSLGPQRRSPVQLLVSNEGVAPALITLSLRADPPSAPPGQPESQQPESPEPNQDSGAAEERPAASAPPAPRPAPPAPRPAAPAARPAIPEPPPPPPQPQPEPPPPVN